MKIKEPTRCVLVLKKDGKIEEHEVTGEKDLSLEFLRQFVPGHIETTSITVNGVDTLAIIDEEGLMKELPLRAFVMDNNEVVHKLHGNIILAKFDGEESIIGFEDDEINEILTGISFGSWRSHRLYLLSKTPPLFDKARSTTIVVN